MDYKSYCNLINLEEETLVIFKCKNNKEFKSIITKLKIIFKYGIHKRIVINNTDVLKIAREVYNIDYEISKDNPKDIEIYSLDFLFNKNEYELSTRITYNKKDFLNIYNELSRNNTMKELLDTKIIINKILYIVLMIIGVILTLIGTGNNIRLIIVAIICYVIAPIIYNINPKKRKNKKMFGQYLDKRLDKSKYYYEEETGEKAPEIIIK